MIATFIGDADTIRNPGGALTGYTIVIDTALARKIVDAVKPWLGSPALPSGWSLSSVA
jgi:hypothetical protein